MHAERSGPTMITIIFIKLPRGYFQYLKPLGPLALQDLLWSCLPSDIPVVKYVFLNSVVS